MKKSLSNRLCVRELTGAAWLQTYPMRPLCAWALFILPDSGFRKGQRFLDHMRPVIRLIHAISVSLDWPKTARVLPLSRVTAMCLKYSTHTGRPREGNLGSRKDTGRWIISYHLSLWHMLWGSSTSLCTASPSMSTLPLTREEGCKWLGHPN